MLKHILAIAASAGILSSAAIAQDAVVEMLNADPETRQSMVFKPALVSVAPGETVTWKPTAPGHNVAFVNEGIPEGVEAFQSQFNQEVEYTFEEPGVYLYKCTPHYGAGMIGVVVVGDAEADVSSLLDLRLPPLAKRRLQDLANAQ
ncbi:MAG: pseudoazurin [Pseudomonadota bacterium]